MRSVVLLSSNGDTPQPLTLNVAIQSPASVRGAFPFGLIASDDGFTTQERHGAQSVTAVASPLSKVAVESPALIPMRGFCLARNPAMLRCTAKGFARHRQ
jgi:hypothetical protein